MKGEREGDFKVNYRSERGVLLLGGDDIGKFLGCRKMVGWTLLVVLGNRKVVLC